MTTKREVLILNKLYLLHAEKEFYTEKLSAFLRPLRPLGTSRAPPVPSVQNHDSCVLGSSTLSSESQMSSLQWFVFQCHSFLDPVLSSFPACFVLQKNRHLGRAMAQALSHRPLTAEARVRSRVSPCGICGGQSGTGTGFSPSTSGFPCQFHRCSIRRKNEKN
jgi:hypothetical protein